MKTHQVFRLPVSTNRTTFSGRPQAGSCPIGELSATETRTPDDGSFFRTTARHRLSAASVISLFLVLGVVAMWPAVAQNWDRATYSSPIAISRNDQLIFSVNPNDDSVSVIRPDNNTRITNIPVGDEPQSIALTPDGQFVYVANAAGNSVSVIQINNPVWGTFNANVVSTLTTGAEPWNIVSSPD